MVRARHFICLKMRAFQKYMSPIIFNLMKLQHVEVPTTVIVSIFKSFSLSLSLSSSFPSFFHMIILGSCFMLSYKYLLPFKAFYMSYKNISRSEIFQLFLFRGGHIQKGTFERYYCQIFHRYSNRG